MTFLGVLCCHFFIASWFFYCATIVFYLWGLDDLFYGLFQLRVLSFHSYVNLVEAHASTIMLRGWSLFRSTFFLRIREILPNLLCWVYNWFRSDIYCYCYILLSFIKNLDLIYIDTVVIVNVFSTLMVIVPHWFLDMLDMNDIEVWFVFSTKKWHNFIVMI